MFISFLSIRCCTSQETVADPNRWWYIFDTLKRNEWSVMCGPGCKTFLLNLVYFPLEIHYRQVVPYLVIVGNPLPNTCLRFWLYTIYVEREMKAFLLDDYYIVLIDIIIISKGFWYKDIWILIREKPVRVIRRGLMRYHLVFWNCFKLFTHTSPMTDPEFTLLFSLNSWVPKFVRAVK